MRSENKTVIQRQYSKEEALALFVDCKLTKQAYILLRQNAIQVGHFLYPSYNKLQEAKNECCPSVNSMNLTETRAEIGLQALLDHTTRRLAEVQMPVLKHLVSVGVVEFKLVSKWGCDGSSGHSRYKQKFQDAEADDEYLFVFSLVPIKLHPLNDSQTCAWQNERTSSTRLCRPIKFLFLKETFDMIRSETQLIQDEILNLKFSEITMINHTTIKIHHQLLLTMIDGKICSALSNTKSSQTCYICGLTPKQMNSKENKPVIPENYGFGLSTLHAWIRSFECLLHISYKLNIKSWQAKGSELKDAVKERKAEIQRRFKLEMGLIVDRPKPGFGSTNDGNTARKFFLNPQISADITGLDERLISRFSVLLQALASGYEINITEFEKYAKETKELYLNLYSWYYLPVTVHKILVHASEIIKNYIVPIGQLSEEAQEARNKDCRRYREHNTKKNSRIATNKDLIRMLLISSDPVIASHRKKSRKSSDKFSREVLSLLKCPDINTPPLAPYDCNSDDESSATESE